MQARVTYPPCRASPAVATAPTPELELTAAARRAASHRALTRRRRRRAAFSLIAIGIVLIIGTIGFKAISGSSWVDAFYFESMLATGQGPPTPVVSDGAKLFASGMAFLSVGTVVTTLLLNIGPILGRVWREGLEAVEREVRRAEHELFDAGAPHPPRPPG